MCLSLFIILELVVKNLDETKALARRLANCCSSLKSTLVIYLIGELGVGKTAFAQGLSNILALKELKVRPTHW